uniref:Uncharacterized protein n=1 Tax=Peromyscus maniculatus bairdii TaxID=230844 RepID=A0A8C8UHL4_PERMB
WQGTEPKHHELDQEKYDAHNNVTIICWGQWMQGNPCGLLGYSRPGAIPEHACLLLPQAQACIVVFDV